MKIRHGFVSNSSSSSFLIVASLEDYEKTYKSCSDYQQKLLDEFFEDNEIDGKKVKVMCEVIGSEHPETLTHFPIIPDYEMAEADTQWKLFDKREKALESALFKFEKQSGVIYKELDF